MLFKYPYTDLYNLNLDWIIQAIKELQERLTPEPGPVERIVNSVNGMTGDVVLTKAFLTQILGHLVETFNGRTGDVELTADDVNATLIDITWTSDPGDTIADLPQTTLDEMYASGKRILVFVNNLGVADRVYFVQWYSGHAQPQEYTPASATAGVTSFNGQTGNVVATGSNLKTSNTITKSIATSVSEKLDKPVNVAAGKFLQTDSNGNAVWGDGVAPSVLAEKLDKPVNVAAGKFLQTDSNGNAVWGDSASPTDVAAATTSWLNANVPTGTTVAIDKSLSIDSAAADAKTTGDAVYGRNELYINGEVLVSPVYLNRNSSGGIPDTPSNIRLITNAILVPPDAKIGITQNTSGTSVVLYRFDANNTLLDTTYANSQEKILANCDHISIYQQYSDNSPITPADGLSIATVKFYYTNPLAAEVESLSRMKTTTPTKLLFDRSAIVLGKYMNKGGGVVESSSYAYTPKIDVSNHTGDTLYFSSDGVAKGIRFLTAFDSNSNAVSASGVDDGTAATTTYTIPSGIVAVVVTLYNPSNHADYKHFQAEWNEITGYIPSPEITQINPEYLPYGATDILTGKKWAVCGDSFSEGVTNTKITGGIYDGKGYAYPYLIGNRTGLNILKFFRGGKTLANPSDGTFNNSFTNQNAPDGEYYQNIPADVDYITLYLGINDGNHDTDSGTGIIRLGTIDDDTTSTYYGAWNVVLTWLLTNRPFAHIGMIISNGCKNSDWAEAQRLIAQKYGIPYLDLNGDDRCRAMIRSQNPNIPTAIKEIIKQSQAVDPSTNTHPNDETHLLESTFIENFLRSL